MNPNCHDFCGLGNDICSLLEELQRRGFNFLQQDHNGRTSLHWLTEPEIPRSTCLKISKTILDSHIPLPTSRENLGRTVIRKTKFWGLPLPDCLLLHYQIYSPVVKRLVEDGYIYSYKANSLIQTVNDLQRYVYHADLLKTINESWKNPRFEDSNGRNGLHCLAEVIFDLPLPPPKGCNSSSTQPCDE